MTASGLATVRRQGDYWEMLTELIAERDQARCVAVTLEREVAALRVEVAELVKCQPTP
jgi:hypothetical protein